VNKYFGSFSQLEADIQANTDLPIIEMRTIPGYSLFDWAAVIEKADQVHTVSTSIIYILEQLELGQKPIHLYLRKPIEQDFRNVDYILTSNYYLPHL
jgi:hypothetical protein